MKTTVKIGLAAATMAVSLAGAAVAQNDWPTRQITFTVATPAGGSTDTWARKVAPFLSEELGVPVVVENNGGGAGILAHNRLLRQDDGAMIVASDIGALVARISEGNTTFGIEDFDYLNAPNEEFGLMIATEASAYNTGAELADALLAGEAQPSMADPVGSGPGILAQIFLLTLGVAESDVRIVSYNGGGPMVAAIMGGQVDFAPMSERHMGRLGDVRPLFTFTDERTEMFPDVPTANEVLDSYDVSMPSMNTGLRAVLVPATLKENYPERYETIVGALERVYEREDALAAFSEADVGTMWLGPEATGQEVSAYFENFSKYLGGN